MTRHYHSVPHTKITPKLSQHHKTKSKKKIKTGNATKPKDKLPKDENIVKPLIPSNIQESVANSILSKEMPTALSLDFRIAHCPKAKTSSSNRMRLFADICAHAGHAETHKERLHFKRKKLRRSLLGINILFPSTPPLFIFFKRLQLIKPVPSLVRCNPPMTYPTNSSTKYPIPKYSYGNHLVLRSLTVTAPPKCVPYLEKAMVSPLPKPALQEKRKYNTLINAYSQIYSTFMSVIQNTVMTKEDITSKKVPIFFNGNPTIPQIQGVPSPCIVYPVTHLTIVDTQHGFRYPLDDQGVDDVILLPRRFIMNSQPKQELLLNALESAEDKTPTTLTRGKKRVVAYQTKGAKYITPGVYAKRAGTGWGMKTLNKLTSWEWGDIFKYINYCESKATAYISPEVIKGLTIARTVVPFPTFPSPDKKTESRFTASFAAARDVCLSCHTDEDSIYGIVSPIDASKKETFQWDAAICCFFTFPELGFAVALRPGDILVFNPTTYHCISSRANPNQHIWCTTLYLKNAVVGGNNNSLPLTATQSELCDMFKTNK